MGRPKGAKNNTLPDEVRAFAIRVEKQIKTANVKDMESLERIHCRLLTSKNPGIQLGALIKWLEMYYGPPKQRVQIEGTIKHEITLEEVRARIIELDRKRRTGVLETTGDGRKASSDEQDIKLLPSNGTAG